MIWILLIITVVILGGSYYAYRVAFFSPAENREKNPSIDGTIYEPYREKITAIFRKLQARPYDDVYIKSHDGLTLYGRYYHTADNAPLAIGFHGYRSSYLTDFCGGSDLSISQGQNLLLIDQRAHGRSQGRTISFGINERKDLLRWIDYALERFGREIPILLYGVSMGGATVLMASGEALPANVKGIVADCPYSVPLDIIADVGKKMKFPTAFTKFFVPLGARIFGGFDIRQTDAIRAVKKASVPILIIHGEDDRFVPAAMSEQVRQVNPSLVRRHTFPGAGHAMSYLVDTERYWQIVSEFMKEVLA